MPTNPFPDIPNNTLPCYTRTGAMDAVRAIIESNATEPPKHSTLLRDGRNALIYDISRDSNGGERDYPTRFIIEVTPATNAYLKAAELFDQAESEKACDRQDKVRRCIWAILGIYRAEDELDSQVLASLEKCNATARDFWGRKERADNAAYQCGILLPQGDSHRIASWDNGLEGRFDALTKLMREDVRVANNGKLRWDVEQRERDA